MQGAFAAACTQAEPGPGRHGVLVWSFADLIHPEYVLESPVEVGTFALNPGQPNMVAGGCITGQVMLWDCSEAEVGMQLCCSLTVMGCMRTVGKIGGELCAAGARCTVSCGEENGDGCQEGPGLCASPAPVICGALSPRPHHGSLLAAGRLFDPRGQPAPHGKQLDIENDFITSAMIFIMT